MKINSFNQKNCIYLCIIDNLGYSRVEVAVGVVARSEATAVILFKQMVEIATLPSVARNDIT
jgi:hypothetical protein